MEKLDRLRADIKDYIMENGKEYERLLFSDQFHNELRNEIKESTGKDPDEIIDFPRLEIKSDVDYDFKLI